MQLQENCNNRGLRSRFQRGATVGEVAFLLLVVGAVVIGLLTLLGRARKALQGERTDSAALAAVSPPAYKCLTTADKLVPIKAVIRDRNGSNLFSEASTDSTVLGKAKSFSIYVALAQQGDFVQLGTDSLSGKPAGWVRRNDILMWTTKEALRPNKANGERRPLRLWERKEAIGSPKVTYEERLDADPSQPYPVLESDAGRYRIALTWQADDYRDQGVSTAWTDKVVVPDEVRFFYYTTRDELRGDFESVNQALLALDSGGNSEHPLVALLKPHVRVTVGEQIDLRGDDLPLFRRILRDLRNPISIAERQPADIKRDSERMKADLKHLRDFYQNNDNWNSQGEGWLPREYLPGR